MRRLRGEDLVERHAGNVAENNLLDVGLDLRHRVGEFVVGVVDLFWADAVLHGDGDGDEDVVLGLGLHGEGDLVHAQADDAYYKLSDPTAQIKSYVEQVILGHVPGMTLDEVFASQSSIAAAVKQELDADMATFGFEIVNVLVTDIVPDQRSSRP